MLKFLASGRGPQRASLAVSAAASLVIGALAAAPLIGISLTGVGEEPEAAGGEVLDNPVPTSDESLARGRILYLRHCQTCHGYDGRALENIDFEATDLTAPSRWRFGTRDGDIFRTTRDGAAQEMPPFRSQMSDEEIWHVVNYVRSLWPEEAQGETGADG